MTQTAAITQPSNLWRIGSDRSLSLERFRLMGILNVTPDSFSDGGRYLAADDAVRRAVEMVEEGAAIIDVGGESTRPGAERVSEMEQIRRIKPVIAALRTCTEALISIDTTLSAVAEVALEMGADIVNDVSAGGEDQAMFPLVAKRGCGLILMHRLLPPPGDSYSNQYEHPPHYEDVVSEVAAFLEARAEAAIRAGVDRESIVLDPGLGFGKSVDQNYQIMAHIGEIMHLGYPVLAASSRKSFLGAVGRVEEPRDRLAVTLAASGEQYMAGVRLFRVHDLKAHHEALRVLEAIDGARSNANDYPG